MAADLEPRTDSVCSLNRLAAADKDGVAARQDHAVSAFSHHAQLARGERETHAPGPTSGQMNPFESFEGPQRRVGVQRLAAGVLGAGPEVDPVASERKVD